jgi:hypothetical protein
VIHSAALARQIDDLELRLIVSRPDDDGAAAWLAALDAIEDCAAIRNVRPVIEAVTALRARVARDPDPDLWQEGVSNLRRALGPSDDPVDEVR